MNNIDQSKKMSVKEAAEYLGLKESRLYNLVFRKKIPHFKIGSSLRFSKAKLDAWMLSKEVGVKNA